MLHEVGRFISDQLKTQPKNYNPDRDFLKGELLRVQERELLNERFSAGRSVAKTKHVLKGYVALADRKYARLPEDEKKQNAITRKTEIEQFGEESIAGLLPGSSVFFSRIIKPLIKQEIHTKQDLKEKHFEGIQKALGVGEYSHNINFGRKDNDKFAEDVAYVICRIPEAEDEEKEDMQRETERKMRLAHESPRKKLSLVEAKKRLDKLVAIANEKRGCSLDSMESNEQYREEMMKEYGDQSVANLLPSNFSLYFHIINPLLRGKIYTKRELIGTPREDLANLRDVGSIKTEILDAMRDLAKAESKENTSNKPQG
jgi:hypothetical protein